MPVCRTNNFTSIISSLFTMASYSRPVSISRECRVLSCCDAEHLHGVKVLILTDEFRDGSLFAVIQEKFRQRVSQRAGNDELGWCNSGADVSQPGAERVPDLGWSDGC